MLKTYNSIDTMFTVCYNVEVQMTKSLPKTVRLMKIIYSLMRRVQIYFEDKLDCPSLKSDLDEAIQEIEQYIG